VPRFPGGEAAGCLSLIAMHAGLVARPDREIFAIR